MAEKQGFMIYHDLLDTLEDFSDQEAGQLLRALLKFSSSGELPDFQDRAMRAVWRELQRKITRDAEKYEKVVSARSYAVYCRESKKRGETPLSREEWADQNNHLISDDYFDIQLLTETEELTETKNETKTKTEAKTVSVNNHKATGTGNIDAAEKEKAAPAGYKPPSPAEYNNLRNDAINKLMMSLK